MRARFGLSQKLLAPLAVLAWCVILFAYGMNAGPLYRTESLRAIIGAECLQGHWLYPVLYGEPFLTKPPGHYVAIALCSWPLHEVTTISSRTPSFLAATAVIFLMGSLFRRMQGEAIALLAAFLLPTSVLWLGKAPSAEIDMSLVGWVTASLIFGFYAIEADKQKVNSCAMSDQDSPNTAASPGAGPQRFELLRSPALWWFLAMLCLVAGTLTKWTAPAFFYLTLIPLLCRQGRFRTLFGKPHLLAFATALAFFAAWTWAVSQEVGWDLLRDTIRKEAAYRFHPPPKAKGYPWHEVLTYPLLVLAAHLPLTFFALRTLRPGFFHAMNERGRSLAQFLHCWVWPNLLFWSIVPNHNVRYVLPLSPALMGLGVMGLWDWWQKRGMLRPECFTLRMRPVVAFLVVWLIVKVVFVEVVVPRRSAGRNAEATAQQLRAHVPEGETLHLFKLKDEGVLFYYGRPARKLHTPQEGPRPCYAVLIEQEWQARAAFGHVESLYWMHDQQGDAIVLVKLE